MKKNLAITLSLLTSLFATASYAVDVPASAESGRLTDRFSGDRLKSQVTNEVLIQDENQPAVAGAELVKFKLNSIRIEGNKVFSAGELQSLYANKLGTEVSLAELYAIRDEITKKYREAGYIISRAVIPAQNFDKKGADVVIKIIEGFVNNVSVQGNTRGNRSIINSMVAKIKQKGALNSADLERYLLLINDLPGEKATAVLRPSASAVGGTDVIITLEHSLLDGIATLDNSGSKTVGPNLFSTEVNLNSGLGLSEEIRGRVITDAFHGEDLRFGEIAYKQPIGSEGTKLKFGYARTATNPHGSISSLGIRGDTLIKDVELTHPLIRSRKENLNTRVGFAAKDTDTSALTVNLYNDSVRVATLGGTYDFADTLGGVSLLDLSVSQGVDAFGASDSTNTLSRSNADATFTRYNFEASRTQKVVDNVTLLVAGAGQYANQAVLASEEFGFGGREFGRGYDFSEITGDSGIAGKVELQYGLDTQLEYLTDIQPYAFYDVGQTWQKEAAVTGEDDSATAASAGAGVRFNMLKDFSGYAEASKPLTKNVTNQGDDDVRFNFGISYLF